jgi:GYF domain 2
MPNGKNRAITRDSNPPDEEWWYYLNRSRQVGPYSRSELRSLLAKDVISPTTLVWQQGNGGWRALRDVTDEPKIEPHKGRQNWLVVALGTSVFFGGITGVATVPTESESRNVFAIISREKNNQERLEVIQDTKQIQISQIAISDFGLNDLYENWGRSSPISAGLVFNPTRASLPSQTSPPARAAVSPGGEFVQEFWRSISSSHVVDRYEFYLRRYPSGAFADIATARIKDLRKASEQASANKREGGAAKKKASSSASKTIKPVKSVKTTAVKASTPKAAGHCWNGNIMQCRERCRAGEARACREIRKLGG